MNKIEDGLTNYQRYMVKRITKNPGEDRLASLWHIQAFKRMIKKNPYLPIEEKQSLWETYKQIVLELAEETNYTRDETIQHLERAHRTIAQQFFTKKRVFKDESPTLARNSCPQENELPKEDEPLQTVDSNPTLEPAVQDQSEPPIPESESTLDYRDESPPEENSIPPESEKTGNPS